jgi:hypothetical protein
MILGVESPTSSSSLDINQYDKTNKWPKSIPIWDLRLVSE